MSEQEKIVEAVAAPEAAKEAPAAASAEPVAKKPAEEEPDEDFQGGEDDDDESIDQAEDVPDDADEMNALNEEANVPIDELRARYAPAQDAEEEEEGPYSSSIVPFVCFSAERERV